MCWLNFNDIWKKSCFGDLRKYHLRRIVRKGLSKPIVHYKTTFIKKFSYISYSKDALVSLELTLHHRAYFIVRGRYRQLPFERCIFAIVYLLSSSQLYLEHIITTLFAQSSLESKGYLKQLVHKQKVLSNARAGTRQVKKTRLYISSSFIN